MSAKAYIQNIDEPYRSYRYNNNNNTNYDINNNDLYNNQDQPIDRTRTTAMKLHRILIINVLLKQGNKTYPQVKVVVGLIAHLKRVLTLGKIVKDVSSHILPDQPWRLPA